MGLNRRLLQFQLLDETKLVYHSEPIWRNGELVGRITSGAYCHTLGAPMGLWYVERLGAADPLPVLSGEYEIEVACEPVPARAFVRPPYDPGGERVRA